MEEYILAYKSKWCKIEIVDSTQGINKEVAEERLRAKIFLNNILKEDSNNRKKK
jgi:hypothetical protein